MELPLPGLRGKFAVALIVASLLPLAVGVVVLQTAGFRHLLAERGRVHEAEAHSLSAALDLAVAAEAGKLRTWLAARPECRQRARLASDAGDADPQGVRQQLAATERAWPGLAEDDEPLKSLLADPASLSLAEFLGGNPAVAELILTDRFGRLIAATRKTSDFDQSDEAWWSTGLELSDPDFLVDPLNFDESAGVYSLDIVQSLHDETGRVIGVVKMVVEVSPLFEPLGIGDETERIEIVLADGSLIARPGTGGGSEPLVFDPGVLGGMHRDHDGWTTLDDAAGDPWMTGYSAVTPSHGSGSAPVAYVVFASRRSDVEAPVRAQLGWVALAAGAGVLACVAIGYALIRSQLLGPIASLREAARSVAGSARLHLDEADDPARGEAARRRAETDLERIRGIRSRDEIGALASDLAVMSERVLRYQGELEAEVEARTASMREDLDMAREFQQAMLPSSYPDSPRDGATALKLDFAHHYQAASTVGGDFFDLIDCGNGRVAVLIADVMGHGARSALVTAILHALVHNHRDLLEQPEVFLTTLNTHLYELIERSDQMLFASAFYLLLDPEAGRIRWTVAGHPAPLRARANSGGIPEPLWRRARRQPALGLVENPGYQCHDEALRAGDVFLLFTDGLTEAENPAGEIFGPDRLRGAFREALDGPLAELPAAIVHRATAFRGSDGYEDDVCVVAIGTSVAVGPDRPDTAAPRQAAPRRA